MTEAPKRRGGRPPFVPTDEQRKSVKILVGLGILEEHICALVRDRPIGLDTLRKYFRKEIEMGAVELNAQVGNFIISTMLGIEPPAGIKPITDEKTRGSFTDLFARSRLGWKQTVRNEIGNADGKPFV